MKKVIIDNCCGCPKTIHGPMTENEAVKHAQELNKIIDHDNFWVEIVDCED